MNCEEYNRIMDAYADDELDPLRSVEVAEHLRSCSACSAAYENLLTVKRSTSAAFFVAPDGLRESVQTALRQTRTAEVFPRQRQSRPWLLSGLAVAAALVLGFLVGHNFDRPSSHQTLLAEMIDSHIRSLVGTHLVDVVSSDQHTVRPWFEGKLDFAPPVEDLVAHEFPLIGGRIEYIGGRPVAALVYQRRKHFINLFIWPSDSGGAESIASIKPQRGYNVLHWRMAGMDYWAVSEISEDDLRKFVGAFSDAVKSSPSPSTSVSASIHGS